MCMAYGEMEIQMICDTRLGEKILVFNIMFDSFDLFFALQSAGVFFRIITLSRTWCGGSESV